MGVEGFKGDDYDGQNFDTNEPSDVILSIE